MTWDEFKEQRTKQMAQYDINRYKPTEIICPVCGQQIYKDMAILLASSPPQYSYECFKCGWHDTSY